MIRYYLDFLGRLWMGPELEPFSNLLCYFTFEGHTIAGEEEWLCQQQYLDSDWEEIPVERAKQIIRLYLDDLTSRIDRAQGYV